jgi:hypothetical protein
MSAKVACATLALFCIAFFGPSAGGAAESGGGLTQSAHAGDIARISQEAYEEMLAASVEDRGGVKVEQGDTVRVELFEDAEVLFFTRPGHRAHPGVVAVQIVDQDGLPAVATSGWWAGDAEAFETWFRVFQRRNERLTREWQEE